METQHRRRLVALLLGVGLWATACGPGPGPRPGVVLVLIDQLRADSARQWMPEVAALARRGVVFEQARSVAPWTYPSVVSLMSGLYPQQHGADGHPRESLLTTFDPEVPLLARLLAEAGYRTAAFVANPFFHRFNPFHEGFDHYDISFVADHGSRRVHGREWKSSRMFADSVNAAVFAHFDAVEPDAPEFTYVHYIDVHGPWQGAPFLADLEPPDRRASLRAAVRYVDRHVARLYDYFASRYRGDLLFFVTSDHGAALPGETRMGDGPELRVSKKSLHDFNLRVPLLILPGDPIPTPRRISDPVSSIDFAPTLLDWLEIPSEVPLPGRSLLPLIRGEVETLGERPLYARNEAFGLRSDAMIWRDRKYVRYFDAQRREVTVRRSFDLESDARELRGDPGPFGRAEPVLRRVAGDHGLRYPARFVSADPEVVEQLRALGYLTGPETPADAVE